MLNTNLPKYKIISERTMRRIFCGVVSGHVLVLLLVLTLEITAEWFEKEPDTINVVFYDPNLDNIVENPSPLPDPDNPIPPSGTQDGSPEPESNDSAEPEPEVESTPEPEINNTPAKVLVPETVREIAQPKVKNRKRPTPAINKKLPQAKGVPKSKTLAQPKVKNRRLMTKPGRGSSADSGRRQSGRGRGKGKGPLGSNQQPGHTAPGGQRGNGDYAQYVGATIKRMWVTPDRNRLNGRQPAVTIEVHIAGNGRITAKRIVKLSGVLAMDESISALLSSLYQVAPPPDRQPCTLLFSIKVDDD